MSTMNQKKQEQHVLELLQRIRHAREAGRYKEVRHWTQAYLNSYDAKCVAARSANARVKLDRRHDKAELRAIAGRLDPWSGTTEEVLVHLKRKPSNPDDFRVFMEFGIENRALQYLVRRPLLILADFTPYQYTIRGGVKAAINHVIKAMSGGLIWAIELDVTDCYPSFEGKQLLNLIPLPKEVTNHVIVSEYLHLVPGNIGYHFGTTGVDDPGLPWELEETLADAQRGIPQGSAASAVVAETLLAIALREIPDDVGDRVAYGDNCLVMAQTESDVATMVKALGGALECHPAGRLRPKIKSFSPGQPVEFLGHRLASKGGGKICVEPSERNREKFECAMIDGLKYLQFSEISKRRRKREYSDLERYVRSWTAAFSMCEGINERRTYWLNKIEKASATI